ncbi:carbohydrate kinase, partial [bacterium]|nr:carbohydrate kinase [bacterium]
MQTIHTIGETLYDIIFKNNQPVSAKAGGAMLNTSVSLGRLDVPISFVSEIGEDQVGDLILDFLKNNNVDTNSIFRFRDGTTALALAFLDESENASYTFYKNYPDIRLDIKFPKINKNDIVLFGSFFAITHEVREKLLNFIKNAKEAGAIIIYDPNFRKPHIKD